MGKYIAITKGQWIALTHEFGWWTEEMAEAIRRRDKGYERARKVSGSHRPPNQAGAPKSPKKKMTDLRPLIAARIGRGPDQITQTEAAVRAGIKRPNLSAWLTGRKRMSLETQIRVAAAVGLDVAVTVTPTAEPATL